LLLVGSSIAACAGAVTGEASMNSESVTVLESSDDPNALLKAALELATSRDPDALRSLGGFLGSERVLSGLNTDEEYAAEPRLLRIRRILNELAGNPAPQAQEVLVALARSPAFLKQPGRVDLLIGVSAGVRPPPPDLVAFWRRHCEPEDGFGPLTVRALVDNDTQASIGVLEEKLRDHRFETSEKLAWLRLEVIRHRNSPHVLRAADRILKAGPLDALREGLVEVLFDYRPGEWYTPAVSAAPPPLTAYTPEARALASNLAAWVLASREVPERTRKAVEKSLRELREG
jgi:hypothetical protein